LIYLFIDLLELLIVQAQLSKELALPYASIALVTDYDCWRDDELPVCNSVHNY